MSDIEEKYLMNNLIGDYQKLTQDIIMYENDLESRDRKWKEIGGIKNPKVPAPASEPMAIDFEYPLFSSSLSVILPTVAVVAALDPETAANNVHAATFTCNNPPGI